MSALTWFNPAPSRYVLEQILSGEPTEVVVENIHEYLNTIGENVRGGKIKLEDFIVFKVPSENSFQYFLVNLTHDSAPRQEPGRLPRC